MRTYSCFYNQRKLLIRAPTTLDAQMRAAAMFRVPLNKAWRVAVVLADEPINTTSL
jgi:hypothetical protein